MGQLTNLFVSSSYQGLLKMTDSTNGLTNTLQTVQTGDGDNSPLQMSLTAVNISGSLTVNGQPIEFSNTGSFVTTSSFNAYTSSVDTKLAGLDIETGSLQNQIDGLATTSSLTSLSSSIATTDLSQNNRLTSIEGITGSLATTSSLTSLSSSIATTDLGQDNRLGSLESKTGSYATTGSNIFNGNQTITGSVNITGNISATSASFVYVTTTFETASIIYSSGSNQFGDASNDVQTLWGRVAIPSGPVSVTGSVIATNFTGSLQGTASFATTTVSSSFAQNAVSASQAGNANSLGGIAASSYARENATNTFTADQIIDSGSILFAYEINTEPGERLLILSDGTPTGQGARIIFGDTPSGGSPGVLSDTTVSITGSLGVSAGITGSLQGNATSATNASNFSNRGIAQFALTGSNSFNGNQTITGSVSASLGFFGNLQGTASYSTNALSSSHAINADTASFLLGTIASSSFATNAATASIAFDLVVNGKCDNPGGLTKGTIVRITGANGDNPLFNSASWTNDPTSANTLGMLSEDVAYNAFANVVVQGKVIGINTNGMTAGDLLFLSSSGQYTTSSVPAPYHEVRLGQVLRANVSNGSAYVSIDNGYELTELHDVDITSPVNGDLLVYRSGSYGQWVNETGGELGFATTGSNTFTGNQTINGSVTSSLGFNGNLEGTASYATNALTASFALNGGGGSSNRDGLITTGSLSSVQSITGSLILSGSAGVELQVLGDQLNTGSLTIRSGSLSTISNTTPDYSGYLSSSDASQSNIILGWGDNLQPAGPASVLANYTGSLRITGSNNIVQMPQIRGNAIGATADSQGYISGSGNFLLSNQAGIFLNTGSLLFPKTQANIIGNGSSISMTFTTSSLAGGHPQMNNNLVMGGGLIFNHNSGSLTAGTNAVLGGNITSNQNFVTNVRPTIAGNNIIGSVLLNHISSSINFNQNYTNAAILQVNNNVSSSITNNNLNVTSNIFFGGTGNQPIGLYASGSQSSNVSRLISDSIFGGRNVSVSSSFVNSSNSNLISTLIVGNGLTVIGNHTNATNGGSAFVGRFNDTTTLNLAQDIVFAVGTGTGTGTRRTGLYVTSGSLVGVSGSLDVKGNTTITGSITLSGSAGPELIVVGDSILSGSVYGAVNSLSITSNTASLNLASGNFFTLALPTGVNTFVSASNVLPGQTINLAITNGGTGTISFSNNVKQPSGSFYTATTGSGVVDVVTLLSVDTNNLYMNNVKNLI